MADSKGGHRYSIDTWYEKITADYAHLSFREISQMNYIDYLALRHDAFIYRMSQSESGQEYLDNAWRMEQTKPDRTALRKKFGKEGIHGK